MADPLFKWAGGKRWLAPRIVEALPPIKRLIEPFAGGAAVFFRLEPRVALLADLNPEVINCFVQIRNNCEGVEQILYQWRNSKDEYARIRALLDTDPAIRAARFLYLTRFSFNGIYRENLSGQFNVPYGHKTHLKVVDTSLLRASSRVLAAAELRISDFETTIEEAQSNEFVYIDPPYTVAHNSNGFVKYNAKVFSWQDQIRLARAVDAASQRGCLIAVSNANHPSIDHLYPKLRKIVIERHSKIGSLSGYRRLVTESLLVSPELGDLL